MPFHIQALNRTFKGFDKERESRWEGPFLFLQAADTQFGMIESYLEKKPNPRWEKEIELARKAVVAANQMRPRPKFLIICGDLIDAMPDNISRPAQIKDFKEVFANLDNKIPLICVCGNHDIGNKPTPASVQLYKESFGDDYFSFLVGGVKFIVLNSQFYKDPELVASLAEEQDAWLDQQLKDGHLYHHIVVFQHIPWFLHQPDEPNDYFNIDFTLRQKMLDKFKKAGVGIVFAGHYHRNAGGKDGSFEMVVTSAVGAQLGNDSSGLRVVTVGEDSISHQYYALEDIPKTVQLPAH